MMPGIHALHSCCGGISAQPFVHIMYIYCGFTASADVPCPSNWSRYYCCAAATAAAFEHIPSERLAGLENTWYKL
jgi:hypothetical protein